MDFNGNPISSDSLKNGGVVNGSLEVDGDFIATDSISLLSKYKLPITTPLEPGSVIVSDGTEQLIWTGDLSVGDVSSITNSTVDNEVVLFNESTGKSVKNSNITVINGIVKDKGEELTNDDNNGTPASVAFRKSRGGGALQFGDNVGDISYFANDSTTYAKTASIYCNTEVTMTPTNRASQLAFETTNENETTPSLKLTLWTAGVEVEDRLITPNVYIGGPFGGCMYLDGDGDKIDIFDKLNNKQFTLDNEGFRCKRVTYTNNMATPILYAEPSGTFLYYYTSNGTTIGGFGEGQRDTYYSVNLNKGIEDVYFRTRGTEAAPLALLNGDYIRTIKDYGYDGTFPVVSCRTDTRATQNWTSTALGSSMIFSTTNNGTNVLKEKLKLDTDGATIADALTITSSSVNWAIKNPNGDLQFERSNFSAKVTFDENVLEVQGGIGSATKPTTFDGLKANGSLLSPTAISNGDSIVRFRARGYDSTLYRTCGLIEARATQNFTPTSCGTELIMSIIKNGQSIPSEQIVIDSEGTIIKETLIAENSALIRGSNKSLTLEDTTSGAGLCNGSVTYRDSNNSLVASISCPNGPLVISDSSGPRVSFEPFYTSFTENTLIDGSLTLGSILAGTHYILPSTKGLTGQHLRLNGNDMEWSTDGGGNVSSSTTSTNNQIVRMNGTTGALIKNSGVTIDDTAQMLFTQGFFARSAVEYTFVRQVEFTNTITGTGPIDIYNNGLNYLPTGLSGGFQWLGKTMNFRFTGSIQNANNAIMTVEVSLFNTFFVMTTGPMPTNLSEITIECSMSFRELGEAYGFYDIKRVNGSSIVFSRRVAFNFLVNPDLATTPFKIISGWDSASPSNLFFLRQTFVSFV